MWFKYFSKEEWDLRMWKGYNLKFEANVYGSSRNMYMAQWHSLIFKVFRCEGVLRYVMFIGGWSLIATGIYLTSESRAKKSLIEEEKNKTKILQERQHYLQTQRLNRFNKPTMPHQSMDLFIDWLVNATAIDDAVEFISNANVIISLDDHANGLDSWLPKSDRDVVQFAKKAGEAAH